MKFIDLLVFVIDILMLGLVTIGVVDFIKRHKEKSHKENSKLRKLEEESKFERFARTELERVESQCSEEDGKEMQKLMTSDILGIVRLFALQGHSGFSASYAINLLDRLLNWKPITPLTGAEDEWDDRIDPSDNGQQNKRCPAVFRNNFDNSTAVYIDGKVFSDDLGRTWFTNSDSIVPITFPFTVPDEPQYVYLDKDGKEISREDVMIARLAEVSEEEPVEENEDARRI